MAGQRRGAERACGMRSEVQIHRVAFLDSMGPIVGTGRAAV
jgi:hypothetical protein